MTSSDSFRRFAFVYGASFAAIYVLALKRDIALFTVFPLFGLTVWGTQHAQDWAPSVGGFPAMYWYGWTATAALGAFAVALVAALLPPRWTRRVWVGWVWVLPMAAMVACVYRTLPWFRL